MEFNQENVNRKITEIKALPDDQRRAISDEIKQDIRAWLLSTFTFSEIYEQRLALWPQSMREETGFGIGTALYYREWTLEIIVPPPPTDPNARPSKHEQTVSGEYDSGTGGYTVTKSHTWSW